MYIYTHMLNPSFILIIKTFAFIQIMIFKKIHVLNLNYLHLFLRPFSDIFKHVYLLNHYSS